MKNLVNIVRKSIAVFALALTIVTAVLPIAPVQAASKSCDFTSGKLCYKITSSKTVTCTGLKSKCQNTASVTIPETVTRKGKVYSVTKVAAGAFKNNDCLKSVTISDTVKSVGTNCFSGCDNLQCVSLGSCVKAVGSNAFASCSNLSCVTCGTQIQTQGSNCFGNAQCQIVS